MQRIVIRHLSGSKANQMEAFPLHQFIELVLGRDPSSTIKYDPNQDDLVSRTHAKIVRDPTDPAKFTLADLNSRNGTYLNKRRVSGTTRIMPGDVIQLGPGGPEFQFDLEPRPPEVSPPTRVSGDGADLSSKDLPPTRIGEAETPAAAPGSSSGTHAPVGRTTVERLIAQTKSDARKYLINGAAALTGIIVVVAAISFSKDFETQQALVSTQQELSGQLEQVAKDPTMAALKETVPPVEIAKKYAPATVYIEASWKLFNTQTGGQLYHRVVTVGQGEKQERLPAYILLGNGVVEPYLTEVAYEAGGTNIPIGFGRHTGSGFVVTDNGFILTNRHVVATWETQWGGDQPPLPGLLYKLVVQNGQVKLDEVGRIEKDSPYSQALLAWVPAKSRLLGGKPVTGKFIEGRHDYLDVTFPKTKLRIPAKLVRMSDTADVALVKVDVPQSVTKVEMYNNYDSIAPGSAVTVLGYPGISPNVGVRVKSQDPLNPEAYSIVVPDVTVTPGAVGRIIRGEETPVGGSTSDYLSGMGDVYQLTVNATGAGNSGGPILDDRGRVIGIYSYGSSDQDGAQISYAVPIKYGMELMSITPVLR